MWSAGAPTTTREGACAPQSAAVPSLGEDLGSNSRLDGSEGLCFDGTEEARFRRNSPAAAGQAGLENWSFNLFSFKQLIGWLDRPGPPPGERAASYLEYCNGHGSFKADEFFDLLLADALHARATDIHLIPEKDRVRVRLRIDGALRNFLLLQPQEGKFLIGRMKVVAGMDFLNRFSPQDGAGLLEIEGAEVPFRISVIPVQANEAQQERAILRLFNQRDFDLSVLGFEDRTLKQWRGLLDEPQGLLVLTGPANSGKTTTIYSSLLDIQKRWQGERNIATIEDPVEFPVPGLSQSQVNTQDDFGFAEALRAMMRQDPQVIMVGEIRDAETAKIALEASLTGHLVLTTVHSKQVTGIFPRMLSLGVGAVRAASAVLAVLNQRLLRLNCTYCAQPYLPSEESCGCLPEEIVENAQFRRSPGCRYCTNTGFIGRTTVSELLVTNASIRAAICADTPSQELYDLAIAAGMTTIWQNALQKVLAGNVALEEAIEVVGKE
jgi:type II secretory ATPase GspE/PulE/Tfp pilus assembly ATPase PilB-like protein